MPIHSCPKQDRCKNGFNCPRDYVPMVGYLCFEVWESERYKKVFHENYTPMEQRNKTKKEVIPVKKLKWRKRK